MTSEYQDDLIRKHYSTDDHFSKFMTNIQSLTVVSPIGSLNVFPGMVVNACWM